jgi:exodeoxyribonuclease (lambda-induced)
MVMGIIHWDIEQRSEEWKKIRRGKITGTDYWKLVSGGTMRDGVCLRKAKERTDGSYEGPWVVMTEHMARGIRLEGEAREKYSSASGNEVKECGFAEHSGERWRGWCGCSPDGLVGENGLIEIKCPTDANFLIQMNIPPKYMQQMQYNLWILDRQWCDYVLYSERLGIHMERVLRNTDEMGKIERVIDGTIYEIKRIMATLS